MCRSKGGGKCVPPDRCSVRERSASAPRALRAVERLARAGATCACDAGCRRAYCTRNGAQQSLSSFHRQSRLSGNADAIAYYSTYVISVLTQLLLQHCTIYNRQVYGVVLYLLYSTYTKYEYSICQLCTGIFLRRLVGQYLRLAVEPSGHRVRNDVSPASARTLI